MEISINTTASNVYDHDAIADILIQLANLCEVGVAFDPWNEMTIAQTLIKRGLSTDKIVQRREVISDYVAHLRQKFPLMRINYNRIST